MRAIVAALAAAALAMGIAGCGQNQTASTPNKPAVVASTDVWGSVAAAVAGDHATVKSILTSSTDDPHSYEASPSDAAEIADASLVVYNGGDYDHWVDDVLKNSPNVPRVDAYSLLPRRTAAPPTSTSSTTWPPPKPPPGRSPTNSASSTRPTPTHTAPTPTSSATRHPRSLTSERAIGQSHPGASVVATEPVAHYLLVNAGIADKTPQGFAERGRSRTPTRHLPTSPPCSI